MAGRRWLSLREGRDELRKHGLRGLIRRYGWKFFAVIFVYYLARDMVIYVVIPWLVARNMATI